MSSETNIPIAKFLPILIVVLAIIAVISFGANQYVHSQDAQLTTNSTQQVSPSTQSAQVTDKTATTVDELVAILPNSIDEADKVALAERAQTNEDVLWIAQHAVDYAFEGEYVQRKMLRLAAYEPDSIEFVRNVLDKYPVATATAWDGTVSYGTVPHLYQWDTKWGYLDYCDTPFGMSGCCPTSFAMVAMALTGVASYTPDAIAADATANGYAVSMEGTLGAFIVDRAADYGFAAYETTLSGGDLIFLLEESSGFVIINVGPGDFTNTGHFLVAVGVADNGEIIINDPYSAVNSSVTWDAERLTNQAITCYVCY